MSFRQVQQEFMAHIRDPDGHPTVADIEDRRLQIYRELFFNNIQGFLSSGFPVLQSIYPAQKWQQLARHFFSEHDCRSPYFVDISKEFVEFLSNELPAHEYLYPFDAELAHYEWLELDLSVRKTNPLRLWTQGEPIDRFRLSSLAELVGYEWPVHQIAPDYLPEAANGERYFFVVHRDAAHEVHFSEINQVTAWLIAEMKDDEFTLQQTQEMMLQVLTNLPAEQVIEATNDIVRQMLSRQIFVLP